MTFACTYAGQPVCLDHDGRLADLLETRWPDPGWLFSRDRMAGSASPFLAGGINDRIKPPYPELPRIRLNEVIVPTGASRYARGLFVVDNVRLKEIVYDTYGHNDASSPALSTLPADWDSAWNAKTLSIIQGGVTFSRSMYLLPPVVLDASGSNTLWLLPLVDARYFWQSKGFEDADDAADWAALVTALVGAAGTSLSGSVSPNAAYGTFDPETFTDKTVSVGAALDAAALSIGHRAVYSGGAAVAFQTAAAADALRTANLNLAGLRLGGASPGTLKAESPRIACRKLNDHWPDPVAVYDCTPTVNNTGNSLDRPSIRSTWYVEHFIGEAGLEVNAQAQTAVQAFADQLATDLLAWGNRPYIASFAGIANWTLSGHDDYLAIRIHDDIGGAAAIMRVASLPMGFRPTVNLCQRPDIYVHPHSTATGALTGNLGPGVNADLTLDAVESLYDGTPETIKVSLSQSNGTAALIAGTKAFLHYQTGQGWCAIAPDTDTSPTWINFTLASNMSFLGTAQATVVAIEGDPVMDYSGAEPVAIGIGSTVTVRDDNSLWGDLVVGCTGKARHRYVGSNPPASEFAIHSSTRPVNQITSTLSGPMLVTDESVTVNSVAMILSQEPFTKPTADMLAEPVSFQAANDWRLHGQYGSGIELERVRGGLSVGEGETASTVYWRVTRVKKPFPYKIIGKLTQDMGDLTSDTVTIEIIKTFGATFADPTVIGHVLQQVTNHYVSEHSVFAWKKGDIAELEYDAETNKYYMIDVKTRANWIRGIVYEDFAEGAATFVIQTLQGIDGPLPEGVPTITVDNIHGWSGVSGEKVVVERNLATGGYEARQKSCTAGEY